MSNESKYSCSRCGGPIGCCECISALQLREARARIIWVFGSKGLPSCGATDAKVLNSEGSGTEYVGGVKEEIQPGTPFSFWPVALIQRFLPHRQPKSPRNYQAMLEKRS